MKIVKEKDANIGEICKTLNKGGMVIFPCETVYGAAVDASNELAVKKLSSYKKRPLGKPYSIMVTDQKMAEQYVDLNKAARDLYKKFLPGPMTIISRVKRGRVEEYKLASGVASEMGTVGIRISNYQFISEVVNAYGKPITATSANASYRKRPYKISDILYNISERQKGLIDLIIDAGELPHNEPSTVVDTTMDDAVTLRQGDIVISDQFSVTSYSEENTQNIGKELWQKYEKHAGTRAIIFALEGEMGTGKTQFTKGLARAMGVKENVVSPTFNLDLSYLTPSPLLNSGEGQGIVLHHMDMWRIHDAQELEDLGIKGLINDKSIMAIEWADRVADVIRKYDEEAVVVWVKIEYAKNDNERKISWGSI